MDLKHLNTKTNTIVIGGKFTLQERIGGGSFGQIYAAINKSNKSKIAVKLEQRAATKNPTLPREAKIMTDLSGEVGFPVIYGAGKDENIHYVAMDLLGLNLEKLFKLCEKQFSLKTVLMLADQMLSRIENLHQKNYLHRDIKPDNFCIGDDEDGHHLYLIDFGLARSYKEYNGQHIAYREKKSLVGTARYASINTHLGIEQSRRDDLESIGYSLVYFLKGELPWQNIKTTDKQEKYKQIADIKMKTSVETLCKDLPQEFVTYFNYIRGLGFTDTPNYKFLKKLFRTLFIQKNFSMDYDFDWSDTIAEHNAQISKKKKQKKDVNTQIELKSNRKMPVLENTLKEFETKKKPEPKKNAQGTILLDSHAMESTVIKDHNTREIPSREYKPSIHDNHNIFSKTRTANLFRPQSKNNGLEGSERVNSTTSGDSFKAVETGESDDFEVPVEFKTNDNPSLRMQKTASLIGKKKEDRGAKRQFVSLGMENDNSHHSKVLNKLYQTYPTANGQNDETQTFRMKRSEDFANKEITTMKKKGLESILRIEEDLSEDSLQDWEENHNLNQMMREKRFLM